MYDIESGAWTLVCGDTAAAGGPRLVFDHQMCIDPDTLTIYVFGGRVLPANTSVLNTMLIWGLKEMYNFSLFTS